MRRIAALMFTMVAMACAPAKPDPVPEPSAPLENVGAISEALTVIPATGGPFNGTTSGSSAYVGTCASSTGPEQVYQWTPTRSGTATFSTCGGQTNFDTVLYMRSGSITGPEVPQACNDDFGCAADASQFSKSITACTTYFIFVDGWGGRKGNYTLTVTPATGALVSCSDAGADAAADVVDAANEPEASQDASAEPAPEGGEPNGEAGPDESGESGASDGSIATDSGSDGDIDASDSPSGEGSLADSASEDGSDGSTDAPDSGVAGPYPLRKLAGARYLVDQAGNPFLIHGDTAWSLIAQLTTEQATTYLDDRSARGVNSANVNLIEHAYADHAPADIYGVQPFTTPGDFSTPNPAYFNRADTVIRAAGARGIQLFLFPAYLGWDCNTSDGWYAEMVSNGATKMFNWGAYLGARYRDFDNLVWVMGGDCDPPNRALVENIANGIRSVDTRHLMTTHGEIDSSLDNWAGEPWLDFNSVYSYPYAGNEIRGRMLSEYNRANWLPTFLFESNYEGSANITALDVRTNAWEAMLNGGMGQFFGNNPIWCFSSGCYGGAWQSSLNTQGAQDQARLKAFFAPRTWWKLVPQTFLTAGGTSASVERASDGSWGAAYFPTSRTVTVNRASFAQAISISWFNPSTGAFTVVSGSPFPNTGTTTTTPPASGDWVLVVE